MENKSNKEVFDMAHATSLAEAKRQFLNLLLPPLIKEYHLRTALDVGCGFGFFSRFLKDLGLDVVAFDGRPENAHEASARNPDIPFEVSNVEDPSLATKYKPFDLVVCLGTLYHLENPFLAIKNLSSLTGRICVIETMVSPFPLPLVTLVEEFEGRDQGLNYIAHVPSESWLLKILYKAGFPYVYETSVLPRHRDFASSLLKKKARTFVIAARERLSNTLLEWIPEPRMTNRYIWFNFGIGYLLEREGVRKALKAGAKLFRK